MAPKPMYNSKQSTLHQELIAALLHKALESDPELLRKIFDESGQVTDKDIHASLKAHNDARHAELMGTQQQPAAAANAPEPQDVRIVRGKKHYPFDGANAAARKILDKTPANSR